MIRKRAKRGAHRRPSRRLDLSDLADTLRKSDKRQWLALGQVYVPEGAAQHYELVMVGGKLVDILVDVETIPDRLDLTCSLAAGGMGWMIPNPGDEVFVAMPAGRVDFRPTIVAFTRGEIPNPTGQGPAPDRIVLAAAEVLVHDGVTGNAEPLVRRSEHIGHTHGPGSFTAGGDAVVGASGGAAAIDGTPVLRA